MKSLSPSHDEQELGALGDFGTNHNNYNYNYSDDFDSSRMYSGNQSSITEVSYELSQCYVNGVTTADCTNVTALNKTLNTMNSINVESFDGKHPSTWTSQQLLLWLHRVCEQNNLDYAKLRVGFDMLLSGVVMVNMRKEEFLTRFYPNGETVYNAFQNLLQELRPSEDFYNLHTTSEHSVYCGNLETLESHNQSTYLQMLNPIHPSNVNNQSTINPYETQALSYFTHVSNSSPMIMENDNQIKSEMDSEGESDNSYTNLYSQDNIIIPPVLETKLQRRKPGRPPIKDKKSKNGGQRNSRLWEFIRDLLLDSKTCPSLLKWENVDEGIFRFVQSDKVARMWGERKCNPRMTYEKLSRAMRYYYKSQVFQPVIGRRLVYKFGPNATGWRPSPALYS